MSSPVKWHDIKQLVVNKDNPWEDTAQSLARSWVSTHTSKGPRVDGITSRATNLLYGAHPSPPRPYKASRSCRGEPTMATATEQMQCSARWWDTSSRRHCYWSDIKNMKNNLFGSVADESFRIVQCLNSHILNSPSQWHSEWVWYHLPLPHTYAGLLLLRLHQH